MTYTQHRYIINFSFSFPYVSCAKEMRFRDTQDTLAVIESLDLDGDPPTQEEVRTFSIFSRLFFFFFELFFLFSVYILLVLILNSLIYFGFFYFSCSEIIHPSNYKASLYCICLSFSFPSSYLIA